MTMPVDAVYINHLYFLSLLGNMPLGESKKTVGLELNVKRQLLLYADVGNIVEVFKGASTSQVIGARNER